MNDFGYGIISMIHIQQYDGWVVLLEDSSTTTVTTNQPLIDEMALLPFTWRIDVCILIHSDREIERRTTNKPKT